MKTILLSALLAILASAPAQAIVFEWKYTLSDGRYWAGRLEGHIPGSDGLIRDGQPVNGAGFYDTQGDMIASVGFDVPYGFDNDNRIPAKGTDGLVVQFFDDASSPDEEAQLFIFQPKVTWQYWEPETTHKGAEVFEPSRWELHRVPDAPATLGLLSLSLLGLAGVKRGWRR